MALVGIGELARMLERDPKALRNAVKSGRITQRSDGLFDTDTVIEEWHNSTLHERGHNNRTKVVAMNPPVDPRLQQGEGEDLLAAVSGDAQQLPEKASRGTDFAKARAASQIYDARLKKLRYDEKAGSLVPARDVEDAAHKAFRCIRDACMSIPSRVSAQLASETNTEKIFQLLENEIVAVFEDFAEGKIA